MSLSIFFSAHATHFQQKKPAQDRSHWMLNSNVGYLSSGISGIVTVAPPSVSTTAPI
jgi:hypothetical protein